MPLFSPLLLIVLVLICLMLQVRYASHVTTLSRMVAAVARWLPVCVEQVDVNGLQPPQATDRVFATGHALRS
jgi:hypothetical protein